MEINTFKVVYVYLYKQVAYTMLAVVYDYILFFQLMDEKRCWIKGPLYIGFTSLEFYDVHL